MPVREIDYESERGKQDASRHREKIREEIKKGLPDVIGEESIITKKDGKIVKVPIRGLKSYHFRHGGTGEGMGQGEGEEGDEIGRQPGPGQGKPGKAGDQPGIDYIEVEIDIEELIEMMLEDLGLPNLQKKEGSQIPIIQGYKFDDVKKTGTKPNIAKKRTVKEGIKRKMLFIGELVRLTGRTEEDCEKALALSKGDLNEALLILQKNIPLDDVEAYAPAIIQKEDLRFKFPEDNIEYQSNALVIAMMDVSGSMDSEKKYLVRSFFFWMVHFLRKIYEKVEIKFISHTTEAQLVDEDTFFYKGESGGTHCWTAYQLALDIIDAHYPPSKWNIYPFHFSDGEDWDTRKTVEVAKKLMSRDINMLGYGEIQIDGGYSSSELMNSFEKGLAGSVEKVKVDDLQVLRGKDVQTPFLGVVIESKKDIWPALKEFLKKERW